MSKLWNGIKKMTRKKKIQLSLAILLTIMVIASIPVLAWFNHQRQVAELQKVKTPDLLYISSAYAEDVKYFSIPSINVEDEDNTSKKMIYPFAVAGEYVSTFTLQLAHTTNIPFTYKVYEADAFVSKAEAESDIAEKNENLPEGSKLTYKDDAIEYTVKAQWSMLNEYDFSQRTLEEGDTLYLVKGNPVAGSYLNETTSGGRKIATDKYQPETYEINTESGVGTYTNVQPNAKPLYWQSGSIQSVPSPGGWGSKPFFKTFIIEISWDDTVHNDKETDMVYISVFRDS